ncbi:hypothetical protein BDW59DRAFT_182221 [Aspergillus cavernicola]|uniref:Enoyl reductase (ER) domain-containing protein n=1 Tax=Aspergillus cavernicola TaxID=176166 RepID=A0ABR4HPR3_9EURO
MTRPTQTRCWVLSHKPTTNGDKTTFTQTTMDIPSKLTSNEILVKTLFLSNDPSQQIWIAANGPPREQGMRPVEIYDVMISRGIGEVIESGSDAYQKGEHVVGPCGWSEYAVLPVRSIVNLFRSPVMGLSKTHYLGGLGLPAITAYIGLTDTASAKKGERVVVSGAAGAIGSMAVQIAKHIVRASHIIGIAGSEENCRWVEKLGADICLSSKSSSFALDLKEATKDGVDVYFENAGEEILDNMLGVISDEGRITVCGCLRGYNGEDPPPLRNWHNVISREILIKGLVLDHYIESFPKEIRHFYQAIADGKIRLEESETIIEGQFEDIPKIWLKVFQEEHRGNLVTSLQ